ncbi:hypothetical protein JCM11641_001406 [Rhodosporidiobolus odoratus]
MAPLLEFKAGRCTRQGESNTVVPEATKGLITLEEQDGLLHFLFRTFNSSSSSSSGEIEDDLIIFPGDATFLPVPTSTAPASSSSNRIHVLKFNSSSARHFYWHQDVDLDSQEYQRRGARVNELIGATAEEEGGDEGMQGVEASTSSSAAPHSLATPSHATSTSSAGAPGAPADLATTSASAFGSGSSSGASQDQLAQLQSILAGFGASSQGGSGGAGAGGLAGLAGMMSSPEFLLPDVLPPATASSLLSTLPPSVLSHLSTFLPPSPHLPTSTPSTQLSSLQRAIASPEFRRSLAGLDRALRTGATGPLVRGLGMGDRAAQGTGEFLEEVQRMGEEEEAKKAEESGGTK